MSDPLKPEQDGEASSAKPNERPEKRDDPSPLRRIEVQGLSAFVEEYRTNEKEKSGLDKKRYRVEKLTLAAIAIYAVVVAFQACQMIRQNNLTEQALTETKRSNELTQRAYVMVPRVDLSREPYPASGDPNRLLPGWGIRIALENSGQTPATITASGPFPVRGLPPASPEQCPSYKTGITPTAIVVPPRTPRAYYLYSAVLHEALTWAFKDRARNHITIYVVIEYIDTFTKGTGKVRRSMFCYVLHSLVNRSNTDRYTYIRGNPERSAFADCSFCNSWE